MDFERKQTTTTKKKKTPLSYHTEYFRACKSFSGNLGKGIDFDLHGTSNISLYNSELNFFITYFIYISNVFLFDVKPLKAN